MREAGTKSASNASRSRRKSACCRRAPHSHRAARLPILSHRGASARGLMTGTIPRGIRCPRIVARTSPSAWPSLPAWSPAWTAISDASSLTCVRAASLTTRSFFSSATTARVPSGSHSDSRCCRRRIPCPAPALTKARRHCRTNSTAAMNSRRWARRVRS